LFSHDQAEGAVNQKPGWAEITTTEDAWQRQPALHQRRSAPSFLEPDAIELSVTPWAPLDKVVVTNYTNRQYSPGWLRQR
jgi:hypothetical protein